MWRTILLGKLSISILASLVVGGVCLTQPWRHEYTIFESSSWIAVGVFFLLLAVAQIAVTYLLTKKPK
jgi:hypothetical protein